MHDQCLDGIQDTIFTTHHMKGKNLVDFHGSINVIGGINVIVGKVVAANEPDTRKCGKCDSIEASKDFKLAQNSHTVFIHAVATNE